MIEMDALKYSATTMLQTKNY
ncbi:unnamed protein product [Tuber melanosporum]|uniref:(Perigord truffle) hypothetical protein n=1 Tax=Tuber melanosporum (strain Mel28) TaxID=656061 RepID=D5GJA6_TUBMM|nr:unnamed protein product [Tuber melanosporum]